jgi:hypothetical protein
MKMRASLLVVIMLPALLGAQFRTTNFIVTAPTAEMAKEFGEAAERYRKQKALEWLGKEMPNWPTPCPLKVTISMHRTGGATHFEFTYPNVSQRMEIEGGYERLMNSVLPHEVTHTVFAHHFRQPVPRWADEGGSVYSEDEKERVRHDLMVRNILNSGKGFRLRTLFQMREYPQDVLVLYAQGFSVTQFLVELSNRQTFLNFVGHGMQYGWDKAAQTYYRFNSVEELEKAWIDSLCRPRRQDVAAANPQPTPVRMAASGDADPTTQLVTRQTAPPVVPMLDPAIVGRGQTPSEGGYADTATAASPGVASRPVPVPIPTARAPVGTSLPMSVPVPIAPQLNFNGPPPVTLGVPTAASALSN